MNPQANLDNPENIPFAIYYAGDAYSTAQKIMGRQSAGKALIKGIARTWPDAILYGQGPDADGGHTLAQQLAQDGYTGEVRWNRLPNIDPAVQAGALYYPAPPTKDLAHLRNLKNPNSFSLMGVTHTLSSTGSMDMIADLILPPFKPWDALICTSHCGRDLIKALHDEMAGWWRDQVGDIRFNTPQLPVIALGVDVPYFNPNPDAKAQARQQFELQHNETVFLFSGRLSFHGKANQAPLYQALEKAAQHGPIVCIESGIFPNEAIKHAYLQAQKTLAPSVRFIWVNGQDEVAYRQAWLASDVFVSISDNIQETFGLTPVEAMAAGLPVIVADWDGYRETIRNGIDGFCVPTVLPPAGAGNDLAIRHAFGLDTYDFYIGRTSMATVADPSRLADAINQLVRDPALRQQMGNAGLQRAREVFDWPVILRQYAELALELRELRKQSSPEPARPWPQRADPFKRFAHFPTGTLKANWLVHPTPDADHRLKTILSLHMANYVLDPELLPQETIQMLLQAAQRSELHTVQSLLAITGQLSAPGVRSLMWLWKFDLIRIATNATQQA
jgi:glycosyltransferase involved in cell wall biosynthesis